jgi:hypothetical protein
LEQFRSNLAVIASNSTAPSAHFFPEETVIASNSTAPSAHFFPEETVIASLAFYDRRSNPTGEETASSGEERPSRSDI